MKSLLLVVIGILSSLIVPTNASCNKNNCLKQLRKKAALAGPFCHTYTTTINTAPDAIPTYFSKCKNSPSRVSSACSCLEFIASTITTTSTIQSSASTTFHSGASGLVSHSSILTSSSTSLSHMPTHPPICNKNHCLHRMKNRDWLDSAKRFCQTYTTTLNNRPSDIPAYLSKCHRSPSRVSSACTCLMYTYQALLPTISKNVPYIMTTLPDPLSSDMSTSPSSQNSLISSSSIMGFPSTSVISSSQVATPNSGVVVGSSYEISSISHTVTSSIETSLCASHISSQNTPISSSVILDQSSITMTLSTTLPVSTAADLILVVQPMVANPPHQFKRQTYNVPVLVGGDKLSADCSDAHNFSIQRGNLFDNGLLVAADQGVSRAKFIGSNNPGPITGLFSIINNTLSWRNEAFNGLEALFCVENDGLVAIFDGNIPSSCMQVVISTNMLSMFAPPKTLRFLRN
jgi:hypothetical protein